MDAIACRNASCGEGLSGSRKPKGARVVMIFDRQTLIGGTSISKSHLQYSMMIAGWRLS